MRLTESDIDDLKHRFAVVQREERLALLDFANGVLERFAPGTEPREITIEQVAALYATTAGSSAMALGGWDMVASDRQNFLWHFANVVLKHFGRPVVYPALPTLSLKGMVLRKNPHRGTLEWSLAGALDFHPFSIDLGGDHQWTPEDLEAIAQFLRS